MGSRAGSIASKPIWPVSSVTLLLASVVSAWGSGCADNACADADCAHRVVLPEGGPPDAPWGSDENAAPAADAGPDATDAPSSSVDTGSQGDAGGQLDADARGCSATERDCHGQCIPVGGCCEPAECGAHASCQSNQCRCDAGFKPSEAGCVKIAVCGDGEIDPGETCDEGTANGTFVGDCRLDCSGTVDVTEFTLKDANSNPTDIVTGPDGNLWIAEYGADHVGQMSPSGSILKDVFSTSGGGSHSITVGPDKGLWFTENAGSRIGHFAPGATTAAEFTLPNGSAFPSDITAGPDGALWFLLTGAKLGRLTTGLAFTEFSGCPMGTCFLYGIAAAVGRIWFTDGQQGQIRSIATTGAGLVSYPAPTRASNPFGITLGPDGNLWFTEYETSRVAYVTTSGAFGPELPLMGGSGPRFITVGPDQHLWFTEADANQIGRVTVAGQVREAPVPTKGSVPSGIVAGPDGNVWFVESLGNKIARINLKKP
jgi:streptogramin lyase